MDEERIPNQSANRDPAEGARESVNAENEPERDQDAGGITNRPLDEELANQRELPLRGDVKVPGRGHA